MQHLIMLYVTLVAVFTSMYYLLSLASVIDLGTTDKREAILTSFTQTVTITTLGSTSLRPAGVAGHAALVTHRVLAFALLATLIHTAQKAGPSS